MTNCIELIGSIVAVIPVPAEIVEVTVPYNVANRPQLEVQEILISGVSPSSLADLQTRLMSMMALATDGVVNDYTHAKSVWVSDAPSLVASPKKNISGRTYEVKVSTKSSDDLYKVQSMVNVLLASKWFHCFIVTSSGDVFFLRGAQDATNVELNQSIPTQQPHEIEITMATVNGLQQIV